MHIVQLVGTIVVALFLIFLFLWLLYILFRREADSSMPPQKMPVLRPIPIPTKNRTVLMRILVWLFEVRVWQLEEDWYFKLKEGPELVVPKDFTFDGASVPRPFWFLLSPVGLLLVPGLIHDFGYKYQLLWQKDETGRLKAYKMGAERKCFDRLFRIVGKQVNGFAVIGFIAWIGVKLGGGIAWRRHREADETPPKPIWF